MEEDENEDIKPASLKIHDLNLIPYQYEQNLDAFEELFTIRARFVLSKEQFADIGKIPEVVNVVRVGIDNEPRKMRFAEFAWSDHDGKIKDEISLCDIEDDLSLTLEENAISLVVKQSIIIDNLLNMLVSNRVLDRIGVDELKANIASEKIREKERELIRLKEDLDEHNF